MGIDFEWGRLDADSREMGLRLRAGVLPWEIVQILRELWAAQLSAPENIKALPRQSAARP